MLTLAANHFGPYGHMGWGGGGGPWMLLGPLWFLFWVVVIGAAIFWAVRARRRWMHHPGGPGPGGPGGPGFWGGRPWGPPVGPDGQPVEPPELALERARAILHERYAKGEISTEEYRERIDNLV